MKSISLLLSSILPHYGGNRLYTYIYLENVDSTKRLTNIGFQNRQIMIHLSGFVSKIRSQYTLFVYHSIRCSLIRQSISMARHILMEFAFQNQSKSTFFYQAIIKFKILYIFNKYYYYYNIYIYIYI